MILDRGLLMSLPSRTKAQGYSPKFEEILKLLRDNKINSTQSEISDATGIPRPTLSKKISGKLRFYEDECHKIEEFLSGRHLMSIHGIASELSRVSEHYLYFSIHKYFEVNMNDQEFVRNCLFGTYELWRYSTEYDDEFVRGKIVINTSTNNDFVFVQMYQPVKARNGVHESNEYYTGYILPISGIFFMILKNTNNNDIRVTIFHRYRDEIVKTPDLTGTSKEHRHIVHLDGFNIGIDGRSTFFSPVYLVHMRSPEEVAELDAKLDVVDEADVPSRILKRLKKFPRGVR